MGTFVFKWPHAAAEHVYVTGTFDDWNKTVQLEKVGDVFQKEVTLKDATTKVLYKFVVDGNWVTDDHAPKETDDKGIENNVLKPEHIATSAPSAGIMSTVGPDSTTAALAGAVPLEKEKKADSSVPGGYPETPATELEKEFKVAPLPATDGAVNPVKLAPGEPVPETVGAQTLTSNVKLDKESYEKADALPGITKETELPPVTKNMIPESSLPITTGNDATISTVTPASTTAGLAAAVPLEEPKVPEIVKESQEKAGVDPEASGVSSEVNIKENVEEELLEKVPEVPSTSEGTAGVGTEKSENDKTLVQTVSATVAGLGAAALATAFATKDKVLEQAGVATTQAQAAAIDAAAQLPEPVKESLPVSVQNAISTSTKEEVHQEVSPQVPAEVKESLKEAHESPEAAANTAAVEEKKKVEAELLKEVKTQKPIDESPSAKPDSSSKGIAAAGAAVAGTAAAAVGAATSSTTDKAADTTAVRPTEPVPPKTEEPTPAVTSTPTKAPAEVPTTHATPSSSKAPESPTASPTGSPAGPSAAERKKKNRLSSLFSKLKPKKDKEAK